MSRKKSIGIFDSGFGGLHIMRGIVKELPEYKFIYLGDTARVPYGTRSREIIYSFTEQAVNFLFDKDCGLIVLACNTASSDALHKIQREFVPRNHPGKKVLGVIIPASEVAFSNSKSKRIGVIATPGTVKSGAFERELIKIDPRVKIFQVACPLLVPLVEAGEEKSAITDMILKKYLQPLLDKKIDTLILGCTHYGILKSKIIKIIGTDIKIIDESSVVSKKLKDYLERHPEIEKNLRKDGSHSFYSTDLADNFQILGSKFFGKKIKVKKAELY